MENSLVRQRALPLPPPTIPIGSQVQQTPPYLAGQPWTSLVDTCADPGVHYAGGLEVGGPSLMQLDWCRNRTPFGYLVETEDAPAMPGGAGVACYTEHVQLPCKIFSCRSHIQRYTDTLPTLYNFEEGYSMHNFHSPLVEGEGEPAFLDMHGVSLVGSYRQLAFRVHEELQLEEVIMLKEVIERGVVFSLCSG